MANSMIAQLRDKKVRLEMEQETLRVEAAGLCRSITGTLVPEVSEIEEMEIAKASAFMDELVVKQGQLVSIRTKIWEIERQLG